MIISVSNSSLVSDSFKFILDSSNNSSVSFMSAFPNPIFSLLVNTNPWILGSRIWSRSGKQKIRIFLKFLNTCALTREETWIAYKQYFLPSITYSFIVVSFSEAECDKMHRKLYPRLLQKMGYKSHMPRSIMYVPRESGGISTRNFNEIILSKKLNFIIGHVQSQTVIGKLFHIMVR